MELGGDLTGACFLLIWVVVNVLSGDYCKKYFIERSVLKFRVICSFSFVFSEKKIPVMFHFHNVLQKEMNRMCYSSYVMLGFEPSKINF